MVNTVNHTLNSRLNSINNLEYLDKIYSDHLGSNLEEEESYLFGYTFPFEDPDVVVLIMENWVNHIDLQLDKLEEHSDEYTYLFQKRGFTVAEFKMVMTGKATEDDYLDERVYAYLFISSKEDHNYFISANSYDKEKTILQCYTEVLKKYIVEEIKELNQFFFDSRMKAYFPLSSLKRHTYILGKTGSGKSELIKNLWFDLQINSNIKNNKSLVCIEPQGKLSAELLQFYLNADYKSRVVYLDTHIRETAKQILGEDIVDDDYIFVLNPFDIQDNSTTNIEYLTDQLTSAFFSLVKSDSSDQMELLLASCVYTLLRIGDCDILTLLEFLQEGKNDKLINIGSQLKNKIHRQTIQDLNTQSFKQTQKSIRTRLARAISSINTQKALSGKSTVDIGSAIANGKVVICNLRQGLLSEEASKVIGRIILAIIQTEIKKRSVGEKHRPAFVFIDEAQDFITNRVTDILAKERQKGLHMILAHQHISQLEDAKIKNGVVANTGIKVASKNDPKSLDLIAKQMGIASKDFNKLKKYAFYVHDSHNDNAGARMIKAPSKYVKIKRPFYMDKKELKKFFLWTIHESGYYTKVEQDSENQILDTRNLGVDSSQQINKEVYKDPFK